MATYARTVVGTSRVLVMLSAMRSGYSRVLVSRTASRRGTARYGLTLVAHSRRGYARIFEEGMRPVLVRVARVAIVPTIRITVELRTE